MAVTTRSEIVGNGGHHELGDVPAHQIDDHPAVVGPRGWHWCGANRSGVGIDSARHRGSLSFDDTLGHQNVGGVVEFDRLDPADVELAMVAAASAQRAKQVVVLPSRRADAAYGGDAVNISVGDPNDPAIGISHGLADLLPNTRDCVGAAGRLLG